MIELLTLHAGHIKTGTSSLQNTFRDNARTLAGHGLYYYAAHRTHHPIARAFEAAAEHRRDRRHVAAFQREARERAWPQGLVSSEHLGEGTGETAAALVAEMRKAARDVRVLMYVRHPVALANSAAAQGIRGGRSLADILRRPRVLPLREMVERWWHVVGRDNVLIRPFHRAALVRGDVVDDALTVLGIPEVAADLSRVQANEALSVVGLHLLERAQAHQEGRLSGPMMRLFGEIAGPRYVLPPEALEDVRRRAEPEMQFLEDAFGIVLPEPDLVPTPPPPLEETELDSLARVLADAARYMDESSRTRAARLFEAFSPWTRPPWDVKPHPLAPALRRLGMSDRLARRWRNGPDGDEPGPA